MGTKQNPGAYDGYANAEPDEPMFVLLARDERAPGLVMDWVLRRVGTTWADIRADSSYCSKCPEGIRDVLSRYGGLDAKAEEALQCAEAMEKWRKEHRP